MTLRQQAINIGAEVGGISSPIGEPTAVLTSSRPRTGLLAVCRALPAACESEVIRAILFEDSPCCARHSH